MSTKTTRYSHIYHSHTFVFICLRVTRTGLEKKHQCLRTEALAGGPDVGEGQRP